MSTAPRDERPPRCWLLDAAVHVHAFHGMAGTRRASCAAPHAMGYAARVKGRHGAMPHTPHALDRSGSSSPAS